MNSRWLTNCSQRRAWSSTISPTLSAKHFGDRTRKPTSLPKSFPFWKMQRNPKRRTLSKASENKVHLFPKRNSENENVCSPKIYFSFVETLNLKLSKWFHKFLFSLNVRKWFLWKFCSIWSLVRWKTIIQKNRNICFVVSLCFTLKDISVETKNNNFLKNKKQSILFGGNKAKQSKVILIRECDWSCWAASPVSGTSARVPGALSCESQKTLPETLPQCRTRGRCDSRRIGTLAHTFCLLGGTRNSFWGTDFSGICIQRQSLSSVSSSSGGRRTPLCWNRRCTHRQPHKVVQPWNTRSSSSGTWSWNNCIWFISELFCLLHSQDSHLFDWLFHSCPKWDRKVLECNHT